MIELQERLKQEMDTQGLTQEQLAEKCLSSQKTISKWVNGESDPKGENIRLICEALHISSDYLLGLQDEKEFKNIESISNYTGLSPEAIEILHCYKTTRRKDNVNPLNYLLSISDGLDFLSLLGTYFDNNVAYEGEIMVNQFYTQCVNQNKTPTITTKEINNSFTSNKMEKLDSFTSSNTWIDSITLKSIYEKNILDLLSRIHESITHLIEKQQKYNAKRDKLLLNALDSLDENSFIILNQEIKDKNNLGIHVNNKLTNKLSVLENRYATNKKKR